MAFKHSSLTILFILVVICGISFYLGPSQQKYTVTVAKYAPCYATVTKKGATSPPKVCDGYYVEKRVSYSEQTCGETPGPEPVRVPSPSPRPPFDPCTNMLLVVRSIRAIHIRFLRGVAECPCRCVAVKPAEGRRINETSSYRKERSFMLTKGAVARPPHARK